MTGPVVREILYVQYFEPASFPPLERSAWQFLEAGWRVTFVGVSSEGSQAGFLLKPHPNLFVEVVQHKPGSVFSILHFAITVMRHILVRRPSVVYCSQERAYPLGWIASLFPGMMTVLHEHDTPWHGLARPPRVLAWFRRSFAARADVCVVPQEERAEAFSAAMNGRNVLTVFNCPSLHEVEPVPDGERGEEFVLWHHGSIGPGRVPMTLIDALTLLPDNVKFHLAGYETVGTRGYVKALKARAEGLGVGSRFTYLGPIPRREDLYARARTADLGLCLFTTGFAEPMAGASNKPFDFLACGLPILINDTPEWRKFFASSEAALTCIPESPQSIARAIGRLLDDPALRNRMARAGHTQILNEWNYEVCFLPVLQALNVVAAPASVLPVTAE